MFVACIAGLPAVASFDASKAADADAEGVVLSAAYFSEYWTLIDGGLAEGDAYVDSLELQLAADLDHAFGWEGARAVVYALRSNGRSIGERAGDLQVPSALETGVEAVRLVEAWIEQDFAGGRGSLRAGVYDVSTEFDAGNVRGLFLNASHGSAPDHAQTGITGPSIWPVTGLGVRASWTFESGGYARAAIVDGVPGDADDPKRIAFDLRDDEGAFLIAEVGLASERRLWSAGGWAYTARFPDLLTGTERDNYGFYLALEEEFFSRDGGAAFDLAGSLRLGVASDDVNAIASFYGATLVATGLTGVTPDDRVGIAIAVADVSGEHQAMVQDAGGDPAEREINIEATYAVAVTDWLSLQPNVQWIVDPGADRSVEDAFLVALRLELTRSWALP